MADSSQIDLQTQLKDAGNNLLMFPPSTQDLLNILDQVEELLLKVNQAPERRMQDALYPSMKALISDQLLRHSDMNVKVSVASCMSELTRITAPDPPYNDEQMKEIFQLAVMALGKLSCETCRCYAKAIRILDNVAKYRSCLLMLDLECDSLIVDMFQQLLRTIGFNHPHVVFSQMEYIMTLTIEESDEISHELLSTLLSSVQNESQNISPLSWKLGERVLKNCAVKLKPCLMEEVKSMGLAFDNYSDVVAFICQDFPGKECETTEKAGTSSGGALKEVKDKEITKWRNDGTLRNIKALNTLERCHNGAQQDNTDARSNSKLECSDVMVASQAYTDLEIQKKRGRKPNSEKKLQDGCNNSRSTEGRKYFTELFCVKNYEKKTGSSAKSSNSRQLDLREEKETNSYGASSKASDLETVSVSAAHSVSYTNGSQPTRNRRKKNAIVKSQGLGKNECTRRSRGKELAATTLTSSKVVVKKEEYFPEEYFEKDSRMYGDEMVGRNIKVWWPLDKKFYEGAISSFDPVTKKHQVLYADGDEEKLDFRNERWELLDNLSQSSDIEKHADLPSTNTLSDKPLKKRAKTKSESPMKQAGPVSSSRRRGFFAAKAKTQTLKSGGSADDSAPKAACIAGVAKDDTTEVNQSITDAEQKSIIEAYVLTHQPLFVVENENITYINGGVPKSTGEQENETLRTELAVGRASPHAIDAAIQNFTP